MWLARHSEELSLFQSYEDPKILILTKQKTFLDISPQFRQELIGKRPRRQFFPENDPELV